MAEKSTNPQVRFERADVEAGSVLKFGAWLVVTTVVVGLLMWWMFRGLAAREARRQPPPPLMGSEPDRKPPAPRLQTSPFADLEELRAEEYRTLSTYGWVDEKAGVVRIPIEEAMRIVAERGLPVRGAGPTREPKSPGPRPESSPQPKEGRR